MSAATKQLTVTRQQAADLIGFSVRQFDGAVRDRIPDEGKQGRGAKLRYVASAVVAAFVSYRLEQEQPSLPPDDPDAALFSGAGNSPNLERMRKFTADLRERDVQERDRVLVRRAVIMDSLRPAIGGMRTTGDQITRRWGNEANELYNDAVNDFEAAAEQAATRLAEQLTP